jgi:hypothetical protein
MSRSGLARSACDHAYKTVDIGGKPLLNKTSHQKISPLSHRKLCKSEWWFSRTMQERMAPKIQQMSDSFHWRTKW